MPAGEVVAIVTGVVACAISAATLLKKPFSRNYSHLKNHEQKLDVLVKKAEELKMLIEKVDTEPTSAVRMRNLRLWINHTEQFLLSIPNLVEQAKDVKNRRCMMELLPNCCSQYAIGRQIAEKIEAIDKILQEGRTYPAVDGSLVRGNVRTTRKLVGLDAVAVVSEMRRIIVFENIKVIGVCGMGGVGKTEVVAHFSNQILQWNMHFDIMIWVEVTHESDLQTLQTKIGRKIGLSLSCDSSVLDNAAILMEALKKKGRVLLILDDMWGAFSLEEIGIPEFSLPRGRGCKLVITSRFSSVCSEMQADRKIELSLLQKDDACRLFLQEVGHNVSELSERTQTIMKSVAAECCGLPLVIIAIARYMRKLNNEDNDDEVSKALTRELTVLRESISSLQVMEDKIFTRLMPSFERLKHSPRSNIQSCFLYCALYPKNHLIQEKELMEYWMWEGLLRNGGWIEEKMQEAEAVLCELKDSGLLESEGQHVKMHPIIRDMAIHISKTSPSSFIKCGLGLRKTPPEEMWREDVERASLMGNDLQEFWYMPNCRNLSTLLLQCNPSNIQFCDGFFLNMPQLKVLDLSCSGVCVLPESISSLRNLHALLLHHCKNLTSLPSLSKLEALMVLDFSFSPVRNLPQGMDKLTKLRRLNLSHSSVSCIQPGLLAALRHLEELMLTGSGFLWGMMSSAEELVNLRNMSVFEADFCNAQAFCNYVNLKIWCQLKSFRFCIGDSFTGISRTCSLVFVGGFLANGEPLTLPNMTSELCLIRCDDITQLRIPNSMTQLTASSFENLKALDISECSSLKHLIRSQFVSELPNIEEIVVKRCVNMVSLINQEDYAVDVIAFPRLLKLTLIDMPNLKQSCNGGLVCNSLQMICIWNCNRLKRFPVQLQVGERGNELSSPCGLQEIKGEQSWFDSLEWDQPDVQVLIQLFFIAESPPDELPQSLIVVRADISKEAVGKLLRRVNSRNTSWNKKPDTSIQRDESIGMPESAAKRNDREFTETKFTLNSSVPEVGSSSGGKGNLSNEEKVEPKSFLHYLESENEETDESDWEDGSIPVSNHTNGRVDGLTIEFSNVQSSARQNPTCRASAEDRELAKLVHKVHLLCLLGRGRLIDSACDDPLIQASLLSILPKHLLELSEVAKPSARSLSLLVNWFHINFHVRGPTSTERSFHSALACALEAHEGTPEEVAALSVALFRALKLTTRFVCILDAASIKPGADNSKSLRQDASRAGSVFNTSTLMVSGEKQVSLSPIKSFSRDGKVNVSKSSLKTLSKNMLANKAENEAKEACIDKKSQGTKRRGDLEFEMQLEMALAATAAATQDANEMNSKSSSFVSPSKRVKRILTEGSPSSSHGISTAIGSKKVGAPLYWAEVYCDGENLTGRWVHVDAVNAIIDGEQKLEAAAAACKTHLRYVVAFAGRGAKDVSRRYCTKWYKIEKKRVDSNWWNSVLAPLTELESAATGGMIHVDKPHKEALSEDVKVKASGISQLCNEDDLDHPVSLKKSNIGENTNKEPSMRNSFAATRNSLEDMELETRALTEPLPTNQQAYRTHRLYAIEKWLTKRQILHPKGPVVGVCSGHPVYPRTCVQTLNTKQRWLREGLQVKPNELPAKVLKCSAKPRKSQFSEADAEDVTEGNTELYGKWQLEPLNLPCAVNGIVPKNERGQVEVWSEKCLPPGTVHLPLPRIFSVAKRLGIDYAPAMVGFEFRNGRSNPVFEGIVVCTEFKDVILEAYSEEEDRRVAEEKRRSEGLAISRWYQLLASIITRQRLNERYRADESSSEISNAVEEKKDVNPKADNRNRTEGQQGKKPRVQSTVGYMAVRENHEHVFLAEDQSFDEESMVTTRKCRCGFSVEVEEL